MRRIEKLKKQGRKNPNGNKTPKNYNFQFIFSYNSQKQWKIKRCKTTKNKNIKIKHWIPKKNERSKAREKKTSVQIKKKITTPSQQQKIQCLSKQPY